MLQITVPEQEFFIDEISKFIKTKEQVLQLEHSLVSLAKWESKWCKPFISKEVKTKEETIDYIRFMTLTQNVDPNIYHCLTSENHDEISEYVNAPMTATTFVEIGKSNNSEIITAEIIYYWMVSYNIPFECQKWHFNRLLSLIKVCNLKNQPTKKMSRNEIYARNTALNDARRAKFNSRG